MTLEDLVGERVLDAVDYAPLHDEDGKHEDSQSIRFRLDGKVYVAVEDPSDGYRSCMRDLYESTALMTNEFEPVRVVGRYVSSRDGDRSDILELIDVVTGKIVLEVGTDNTDDYYPSFVANFTPENMTVNRKERGDFSGR